MNRRELLSSLRARLGALSPVLRSYAHFGVQRWRQLSRRKRILLSVLVPTGLLGVLFLPSLVTSSEDAPTIKVVRGNLRIEVAVAGKLAPLNAETYGGEIAGAELKISELTPDGAQVTAGTLLIRFDDSPFRRELESARARLAQTRSEAEQARQAVRALAAAERSERAETQAAVQRATMELEAFQQGTAPLALQESATSVERCRREAEEARQKVNDLAPFAERGFISREELRAARRRAEQAESDLQLALQRHDALARYIQPQLLEQKKSDLVTRSEAVRSAGDKAAAQIAQARAALELAESRVNDAVRAEAEALRRIDLCAVRARSPGLVVYREVFEKGGDKRKVRVGDSSFAGQPILDLPDLSKMLVETRVRESEIQSVRPGLGAEIRLEAFPLKTFPGRVLRLGALTAGEKGENRTFPLVLELLAVDPRMRPGMSGQALILADDAKDVLLVPIEAVRRDAAGAYCFVKRLFGVRRVPLTVGRNNATQCEVVSGLVKGDVVLPAAP